MKRCWILLLTAVLLLTGCTAGKPAPEGPDEAAPGQTLTLTVKANPTTGFSWAAAQDAELFDIQSSYTAEPQAGPVSGSGGWQTFVLTPKEPGTARVSFTYSRPWEPGVNDLQMSFTIEVSEDLRLSVIEDDSAEAAEHGYAPQLSGPGLADNPAH